MVNPIRRVISLSLIVLSLMVILLALVDYNGVFRLVVVLAFALTAPGWAVVAFWKPANPAMEWSTAICLSMAIVIIVSMAMVVLSTWSPVPVAAGLAAVTAGVLTYHLIIDRRSEVVTEPAPLDPEFGPADAAPLSFGTTTS